MEEALEVRQRKQRDRKKYTFIDLFAGIGGIRLGFESAGCKCVFTSEWDKYAQKTYQANFPGEIIHGDITKVPMEEIPAHDILTGGFPCQPFSIAGVSKKNSLGRSHGFKDETQGTLFFNVAQIIEAKRPKAFLLENVKNLVRHDKGRTFSVIKRTLEEDLNYKVYYKVIDGKHFVPQHRERIFIVGMDREVYGDNDLFEFPVLPEPASKVSDILYPNPDPKYTLTDNLWTYLQNYAEKHKAKGNGFGFGLVDLDGITRTLSARYHKDGSEILIPQSGKNPRRLTPRECARLMGYPEDFVVGAVSDTQAYRQFGNSVVVPVIMSIAKALAQTMREHTVKPVDTHILQ